MNSSNENLTGKAQSARLFIAVGLPTNKCRILEGYMADLRKRFRNCRAAWVKPDNYHLTLRFLGDTPVRDVQRISEMLDGAVSEISPFVLSIAGTGSFRSGKSGAVLWLGLAGDLDALKKVKINVDLGLVKIGIRADSVKFNPHLTLARIRYAENCPALIQSHENAEIKQFDFGVRELCLIKSDLCPSGPRYTVVHRSQFTASQDQR